MTQLHAFCSLNRSDLMKLDDVIITDHIGCYTSIIIKIEDENL